MWVWRTSSNPRILHFLIGGWTLLIPCSTNIITSNVCPCCHLFEEFALHCLRDCPVAAKHWDSLSVPSLLLPTFHSDIDQCGLKLTAWPISSIALEFHGVSFFLLLFVHIWLQRNNMLHKHAHPTTFLNTIIGKAFEWQFLIQPKIPHNRNRPSIVSLGWTPPPNGWFKLNTDGSGCTTTSEACAGGIDRDWNGNWIIGFSSKLGLASSLAAEMMALQQGLY